MKTKTFEQEFQGRIAELVDRAYKAGVTLSHICRETGIARATPDRWREHTPKTITLVDQIEAAVVKAEKAAAAKPPATV